MHTLTNRQLEVVELIADGHNNESIGHQLEISEMTARRHIHNIFHIVGVNSRTELAVRTLTARHAAEVASLREEIARLEMELHASQKAT